MMRLIAAVALAASVSACASVVRGTTEQVAFVSEPPGATMTTNTKYACPQTPCSIEVERTDEFDATFAKPGYHPVTIPVRTKMVGAGAAGLAGNVIAGGIVGIGVDAATGATLDHTPNPVVANLQPLGAPKAPRAKRKAAPKPPTT